MAKRRPSSANWLREHHSDPYVLAARRAGYRSRAAYKLLELHESMSKSSLGNKNSGGKKSGILHNGMTVVDLGAAPGGWTQVALALVGSTGRVVAVDRLAMAELAGAVQIQGDFLEEAVLDSIHTALGSVGRAHAVLSDMAPNLSGIPSVDQARGEVLAESATQFAESVLLPGGRLVVKLFQGGAFHEQVKNARRLFERVKVIKPPASRSRSAEHYLIGIGFRGTAP